MQTNNYRRARGGANKTTSNQRTPYRKGDKLTFVPNNFSQWRRDMETDVITHHGDVGIALRTGMLPDWDDAIKNACQANIPTQPHPHGRRSSMFNLRPIPPVDSPVVPEDQDDESDLGELQDEVSSTSNHHGMSARVMESLMLNHIKLIYAARLKFHEQMPMVCGRIMSCTSTAAATRIRAHPDYEDAWHESDMLALWRIIRESSVQTPLDLERQVSDLHARRNDCYQYDRTLEAFAEEFEEIEEDLVLLGRPTMESELVLKFLDHLNPIFCQVISVLRSTGQLPDTYAEAKAKVTEHESTARTQYAHMRGHRESTINQDAALAAYPQRNPRQPKKHQRRDTAAAAVGKAPTKAGGAYGPRPKHAQSQSTGDNAANSGLIRCAYCDKMGRHTAQDCNQLKAHKAQQQQSAPAGTVALTVDDVILASVLTPPQRSGHPWPEESDEGDSDLPELLEDTDSEDEDAKVATKKHPPTVTVATAVEDDNALYLDNACTTSVVRNINLLNGVRTIAPRTMQGLGRRTTDRAGELPHFGFALYVPQCPLNLISFNQMRSHFVIKYSMNPDRFTLTRDGRTFNFDATPAGLYVHRLGADDTAFLSDAVTVNGTQYTAEQLHRAQAASELHERLGHPSDQYLIHALDSGAYLDCSVTSNDVRLKQRILGKCTACMEGKATEEPSKPSTTARAENVGDLLHVDIAFINGAPILVSVDDHSGCIAVVPMPNKNRTSVETALRKTIAKYNSYQHKVSQIRSDREAVFRSVEVYLNTQGIQLTHCGPGRHNKKAERAIRTLKEKFRSALLSLKYHLPPMLYTALFADIAQDCNLVPTAASGFRTPREIVTGTKLNVRTHLRASFGDIVMCTPPKGNAPSTHSRAEYAIVVGRDLGSKGDIKVFTIYGKETVIRHTFQPIALTDVLVTAINALTTHGNSPTSDAYQVTSALSDEDVLHPSNWETTAALEAATDPAFDVHDTTPSVEPTPALAHRGDDAAEQTTAQAPQSVDPPELSEPTAYVDPVPAVEPEEPPEHATPPAYALRPKRSNWREYGLHISVKAAIAQYGDPAVQSMREELTQLLEQQVWKPVHKSDLTPEQLRKIIPSSMFLKAKTKPDGSFDKLKSRLVAGGHRQDNTLYENVSSPCVNMTSLFLALSVAAYEQRIVEAVDIKGAYLNAKLTTTTIHMRIAAPVAEILSNLHKELYGQDLQQYLCPDGTLLVLVLKALYGLIESALLWYEHLVKTLCSIGYTVCQHDRGVLQKRTARGGVCTICLHVDDLLILSTCAQLRDELLALLTKVYKDINVQDDPKQIFYLGMQLDVDRDNRTIHISQPGFIDEILSAHPVTRTAATPATDALFNCSTDGTPVDRTDFASRLMKLAYLAKRSRPDLSLVVAFLATRMSAPDHFDDLKLVRAYQYLYGTKTRKLTLHPDQLRLHYYLDASYAVHHDMASHSGGVLSLGTACTVYVLCCKQKIITDSTSYAELVTLHSGVRMVQWAQGLLHEWGYKMEPAVMYQDNQSTIILAKRGPGTVSKSRHFNIRYFYVHYCIKNKELVVEYCPTEKMRADFMSKPKTGRAFKIQCDETLGNSL